MTTEHEEKVSPVTLDAILMTVEVSALDVLAHHINNLRMLALVNQFHTEVPWLALLDSMIDVQESATELLDALFPEIMDVPEPEHGVLMNRYGRAANGVHEAVTALHGLRQVFA
jgi:hypothetical protein